jgi:hypothetical protein
MARSWGSHSLRRSQRQQTLLRRLELQQKKGRILKKLEALAQCRWCPSL